MKRIKSFGVIQTAKVVGIIYFLLGFVVLIPLWLVLTAMGPLMRESDTPFMPLTGTLLIMIPIFYGMLGFVITAVGCLIYNLIARWTGGIELEVETMDSVQS